MSRQQINHYYNSLSKSIQYSGSRNETTIRTAFLTLLNSYAETRRLLVVTELGIEGTKGRKVYPDGVLKNAMRLDFGYWESKDERDDIDREIEAKRDKGYPFTNILFEDSRTAVLFQNGGEAMRVDMEDPEKLDEILTRFIGYEPPQVREFNEALKRFGDDVPHIAESLRDLIDTQAEKNPRYIDARDKFLELCREEVNPDFRAEDVREMIIQHILTEDIFVAVFGESDFHRDNNIARELEGVIASFMARREKRNYLEGIAHYYETIRNAAAGIADHNEKQKFLKLIYETFYKVYNPKGADTLGVVYTPNEIVRFMVESTDTLLYKHFGRGLQDKNVEILDPCTGTGTFVTDIIDYIAPQYLEYKYRNEIHANEVAILPYYVSNLNIEYAYKQKMGKYVEFPNICFVDTLDNTVALDYESKQGRMFGFSSENSERIKRQNERKISVIIGNPPYNAKQELYNDQNANRSYPEIDKRIKETFIKEGTAQNQIVVYDMYTRFIRWAMDRIDDDGIIAFVSNNSFIDGKAFDGFRKCLEQEFDEIIIVDTRGNARTSGELRRQERGNVFSDQIRVGVAVYFLVKNSKNKNKCNIQHYRVDDYLSSKDKLDIIRNAKLDNIRFDHITPSKKHNWINLADNDWEELIPLMDKKVKAGGSDEAVFRNYSRGVATQRDEWVYDLDQENLEHKVKYMVNVYEKTRKDENYPEKMSIKWDRELEKYRVRDIKKKYEKKKIIKSQYRPFSKRHFYFDKHFNGMVYQWNEIFNPDLTNEYICINSPGNRNGFHSLVSNKVTDLHFTGDSQCLPLYTFDSEGNRRDNITDWGLRQFRGHYGDEGIGKEDIFHYVYGVLHNPEYRKKYELNLKREFPRVPFYGDFWAWAERGKRLMELHIGYEDVEGWGLERVDYGPTPALPQNLPSAEPDPSSGVGKKLRVRLKADKDKGVIYIDENTELRGVPREAWEYKLGNRSALEWVLDQYKEKKPRDKTILEKFNTYRFADYKEEVIELLDKVCRVSVETVGIVRGMEG